jgi:acid phosphatase (class A)
MKTTLRLPMIAAGLVAAMLVAGCATTPVPTANPADLKGPKPGLMPGYLAPGELIDGVALLPQPPQPGSAAQAADEAAYRAAIAARDGPRWKVAIIDAEDRDFERSLRSFACSAGMDVTAQRMPHFTMLLRRSFTDLVFTIDRAKEHYKRTRPFAALQGPNCTPESKVLAEHSYPSGHATVGWGVSLVMAEVLPERASALAARGRDFGQSRVACGVHWQSDVDAGRDLGAAVVARLHASPEFRAQLAEARKEVVAARAAGATPSADCALEAAALRR